MRKRERERAVAQGGQDPQNLALPLHRAGVRVLGTDPWNIDRAEDREKHSALLQSLSIDQPGDHGLRCIIPSAVYMSKP